MPVLTPLELWQQSGRDYIQELFRLKDRKGADYVLPMTHEETVTFHARELQSYRQLPQMLYHFSIKERDEPRPRAGPDPAARVHHEGRLLVRPRRGRAREELRAAARRVPADLRALRAEGVRGRGRVGDDGRQRVGRLPRARRRGREHARHVRERRFRGRPRGRARHPARAGVPRAARCAGRGRDARTSRPARRSPSSSAIDVAATSKAMPVTTDDGTVVLALVRGDDRHRAGEARRGARPAVPSVDRRGDPRRLRRVGRLARPGRLRRARSSPTTRCARGSSSPARTATAGICAASRRVATSSRASPTCASRDEGDTCPNCGGALQLRDGDRGRAHLQARDALLGAARRDVPRRGRPGAAARDGELRHRPGARDGGGRRAAATTSTGSSGRRRSRRTTCTSSCSAGPRRSASRPRRRSSAAGQGRAARRPRPAPGREVRRRRPDRDPDPGHGGEEEPRGRRGRRPRPRDRRGATCERRRAGQGGLGGEAPHVTRPSRSARRSSG